MRIPEALLIAIASASGVFAAETIDFYSTAQNGHTGTINYLNNGGAAVGSGIDVDYLTGFTVPVNGGSQTRCFNCALSFTTGLNVSNSGGHHWIFNSAGSSFKIVGGFDLNGNGVLDASDIQPGATLLTGHFNGQIDISTPNLSKPDLLFTAATVLNTLNAQLTSFYGIPAGYSWNGLYSQSIDSFNRAPFTTGSQRYRFQTFKMLDGVTNDTLVAPEPMDLVLSSTIGLAITGVIFMIRRRRWHGQVS